MTILIFLYLSSTTYFVLSLYNILFSSLKLLNRTLHFGISVVVPLGNVGVTMLSFCCVFYIMFLIVVLVSYRWTNGFFSMYDESYDT